MTYPVGMDEPPHSPWLERLLEGTLFSTRWLLAPIYIGLGATLVLVLISFVVKGSILCANILQSKSDDLIIGILSLIDLSLIANLVLIVVWAGYENFVTRPKGKAHPSRPEWISRITYGDLKLKLMTSIVAISAIHVLEDFMHVDVLTDRHLAWSLAIHGGFMASALLLAVMDRISAPHD
jgi:uncharacterized protein (TIGR00645 family)